MHTPAWRARHTSGYPSYLSESYFDSVPAEFGEFFSGEPEENARYDEESFDSFEHFYDEADGVESYLDEDSQDYGAEFYGADAELAEQLLVHSEWQELQQEGISPFDALRYVFPDLAEADDFEVEAAIHEMTEGMSPEEVGEFWKSLGRIAKSVVRVAAPIVQAAAPIVGTALGGPLGGAVGGLVSKAVGMGSAALNRPRVARPVRGRPRFTPHRGRPVMRAPRVAGGASRTISRLLSAIQNPAVQRTLLSLIRGESLPVETTGGESLSAPAVLVGLHGAILESLREMQDNGMDLDYAETGYGPGDFNSAEDVFETLDALLADARV